MARLLRPSPHDCVRKKNTGKRKRKKTSKFGDNFSLPFLATLVTGEFRETTTQNNKRKQQRQWKAQQKSSQHNEASVRGL
jgi:hypothetical protein